MLKMKLFFYIILVNTSCFILGNTGSLTNFVIIVASYNNARFYKKNLDSIVNQKLRLNNKLYPNYRIIYINDCSTDNTGILVENYLLKNDLKKLVKVIHNNVNKGHLFNQYHAIHSCKDNEVIVIVDGDDFLYNDYVLDYLNNIYKNKDIWLTYGQSECWPRGGQGNSRYVSKYYFKNKLIRRIPWCFSHLRTFYSRLFKKIKIEDLIYEKYFFKAAADLAVMYPMLEMCGYNHIKFISKHLYLYNTVNPNSFFKKNINLQFNMANFIQKKPSYDLINLLDHRL